MSARSSALIQQLLARYRQIGLKPPPWAWDYRPSIPFVGVQYLPGGILAYASAENLSKYERNPSLTPSFMKDERVLNRHRNAFSVDGRFFPFVHMQPFDDGSLIVAVQHYLATHHRPRVTHGSPETLLEHIAAANCSKFSIRSRTDQDIAGSWPKLKESLGYVSADLAVLKPGVIIMPRTIWRHPQVSEAIQKEAPRARIVALPQFNPRVANTHLRRHAEAADEMRERVHGSMIANWIDRVPRYAPGSFYRFLVELDREVTTSCGAARGTSL